MLSRQRLWTICINFKLPFHWQEFYIWVLRWAKDWQERGVSVWGIQPTEKCLKQKWLTEKNIKTRLKNWWASILMFALAVTPSQANTTLPVAFPHKVFLHWYCSDQDWSGLDNVPVRKEQFFFMKMLHNYNNLSSYTLLVKYWKE